MRLSVPIVVFLGVSFLSPAANAAGDASAQARGLVVRVEEGGWGPASPVDVATVLQAAARPLLAKLPPFTPPMTVVVSHTGGNPITWYDRGPAGEYLIGLHASGTHWDLYVYEFAHELCHVLSNYDAHVRPGAPRRNQWFEESLCEAASLYALRDVAAAWGRMPPDTPWPAEAGSLRRFEARLLGETHRRLPPGESFGAWLDAREEGLRSDHYRRDENDLVAKQLLPLLRRSPEAWPSVRYLNLDPRDPEASFADYLRHWYANAPGACKPFVAGILDLFGVDGIAPPKRGGAEHRAVAMAEGRSPPALSSESRAAR